MTVDVVSTCGTRPEADYPDPDAWKLASARDITQATGDDTNDILEFYEDDFPGGLNLNIFDGFGWTTGPDNRVIWRTVGGPGAKMQLVGTGADGATGVVSIRVNHWDFYDIEILKTNNRQSCFNTVRDDIRFFRCILNNSWVQNTSLRRVLDCENATNIVVESCWLQSSGINVVYLNWDSANSGSIKNSLLVQENSAQACLPNVGGQTLLTTIENTHHNGSRATLFEWVSAANATNNSFAGTAGGTEYGAAQITDVVNTAGVDFVDPANGDWNITDTGKLYDAGAPVTVALDITGATYATNDVSCYAFSGAAPISAAVTGTTVPDATESEIVTGGQTTIVTLTNDTWVGQTATEAQLLIDACTSFQNELTGWNNEVRDKEVTTAVSFDSTTVATITWSAAPAYAIGSNEQIQVTLPAALLTTSTSQVVAQPNFQIIAEALAPISFPGNINDISGTVGQPITPVDVSGEFSGDLTPFTYSEFGTAWPSWANLDSGTGIISGTPNAGTTADNDSDMLVGNNGGFIYGYRNEPPDTFGAVSNDQIDGQTIVRVQANDSSKIVAIRIDGSVQLPGVDTLLLVNSTDDQSVSLPWEQGAGEYRVTSADFTDALVARDGQTVDLKIYSTSYVVRGTDTNTNTADSNGFRFLIESVAFEIIGDITTTFVPSAALQYTPAEYAIAGDVTTTFTPAATLAFTPGAAAIIGDVKTTFTPAATLVFTPSAYSIIGDVTTTFTPAATLDFTFRYTIDGDVTTTFTPAASLIFIPAVSIIGDVTTTFTPQAVLNFRGVKTARAKMFNAGAAPSQFVVKD